MSYKVDISAVSALTRKAHSAFDTMVSDVFGICQEGAAELVATDHYQNHTHDLRDGTLARLTSDYSDGWSVNIEMDTEYAAYVVARGFSNIEQVAGEDVPAKLDDYLSETMPGKIGL